MVVKSDPWPQAITWANVNPDLCRHVASLGHSDLIQGLGTTFPANTKRNKHVIITSSRRFDVMITCLLRLVSVGFTVEHTHADWSMKLDSLPHICRRYNSERHHKNSFHAIAGMDKPNTLQRRRLNMVCSESVGFVKVPGHSRLEMPNR